MTNRSREWTKTKHKQEDNDDNEENKFSIH